MITPTKEQLDTLSEMVNIGMGKAASILNEMLDSHIELAVPSVTMLDLEKPSEQLIDLKSCEIASVQLDFHGSFSGNAELVISLENAEKLVVALTDEKPDSDNFDTVTAETLYEIGNILINAIVGSIANILTTQIDFSPPNYREGKFEDLVKLNNPKGSVAFLLVSTNCAVQDSQITVNIFLVFELGSLGKLLTAIDNL